MFGVTRFGAYATHVCVPEDFLFPIPRGVTLVEAAGKEIIQATNNFSGFPAVWLTAYYGLVDLAHPKPGQTILVHSAAGGVGSCLVQLGTRASCKILNCHRKTLWMHSRSSRRFKP